MLKTKFLRVLVGIGVVTTVFAGAPTYAADQTCVDGNDRNNLNAALGDRGTVTIRTVDNKPLCDDITLNLSSYTLPDNYNGKGFKNNPTAIPQKQFANSVVTIGKGTNGLVTVKVPTPEACKATQVDLYHGNNQTEIKTSEGLVGTDAIVGKLYDGSGACAATSTVHTTQQPPAQEVVATTQSPKLPSTGLDSFGGGLIATIVAAATYGIIYLVRSRPLR